MKYSSLLATSAALAALAIVAPAAAPTTWNLTTPAYADDIDISFSFFYDDLGDHGDWVPYDDAYVFVPARTGRHWRPYAEGHWAYTNRYGWMWISDEPFGWATYHYGRWGYGNDIGWYWVPGTRWAPAWVSWRRSGDHVAWAPLPPSRGWYGGDSDFTGESDFDDTPDYYWNVVPTTSFLSVNLFTVIIKDDDDRRHRVREAEFAGNVKTENNVVVNNAIEIDYIEEKSGKKVKKVEVKETADPKNAKAKDGEVVAFTGEVESDSKVKPPKVTKVEEVKEKKKGKADQAEQTGESGNVAAEADADAEIQSGKKKDKAAKTGDVAVETDADAQAQSGKKNKVKAEQSGDVAVETKTDAQVQSGKKKKVKAEQSNDAAVETEVQAGKNDKKVKDTKALSAEDQAAQTGKKKKKKDLEEEPAVQ